MLKKNELKEEIRQIYVATVKPGFVRGNHYHLKRKEWFFIIQGKAKIFLQDLKTKKKISFHVSSKKPKLIEIPPKVAHAVKNIGKQTLYLVSAQNDIYNPKKPDTYEFLVVQNVKKD